MPESLVIVGGGVIGCEFASMLAPLGCRVILIEALPALLATEERRVSQTMAQALSRQGVEVLVGTTVSEVEEYRPDGVALRLSDGTRRRGRAGAGGRGPDREHGRHRPGGAGHPRSSGA